MAACQMLLLSWEVGLQHLHSKKAAAEAAAAAGIGRTKLTNNMEVVSATSGERQHLLHCDEVFSSLGCNSCQYIAAPTTLVSSWGCY